MQVRMTLSWFRIFFFFLNAFSSHLTHQSCHLRVELEEPYHFWAWGNLWRNTDKGGKPAPGVMTSSHRCLSQMRKHWGHCPLLGTQWWVTSWAVLTPSIYVKLDLVSERCSHDPGFTDSHAGYLCRSGCQPGVKRFCSKVCRDGYLDTTRLQRAQARWRQVGSITPPKALSGPEEWDTVTQPWTSASRAQKARESAPPSSFLPC